MGILCVDFVKAFDSVEHAFIRNTLQFFNFGGRMVQFVMAILNKRVARVAVGDSYTESFCIERGTPQGDRASPFIFILCIEILLIKFKSKEGNGINNSEFLNQWARGTIYEGEGTAEGFADDLTLMFLMSNDAMALILAILEE